jgi:hypothetical protein
MSGIVVAAGILAVLAALLAIGTSAVLRRRRLGENREKWQDQTTGPAGAMFNALFLAAFALCAVIGWQSYSSAKTHNDDERTALTQLYTDVSPLPNGAALHTEIVDYTQRVINVEWPLMRAGRQDPVAAADIARVKQQLLTVDVSDPSTDEARSEAMDRLDDLLDARDNRLGDTTTTIPAGLLICVLVAAVVVVGHALVVGLPHTASSLIPLATEAALITVAVLILFLIRQPYHGSLNIPPDAFTQALNSYSQAQP